MALVTPPVVYPVVLAGKENGELPAAILISTPGIAGGPTVRLVPTATRCWRALSGTALKAGVVLQATSYGDSYRSLRQQVNLFTSRYQLEPTGNGYKLWDSDGNGVRERWYKMDGVATAAVPGTSNHGWAIAVDIANASGARLRWLEANAPRFGWGWELVPEETWHIRNFTGDAIPAAVIEYEEQLMADYGSLGPPPNVPDFVDQHPDIMLADLWAGLVSGETGWGGEGSASGWTLYQILRDIQTRVAALEARPPVEAAPVDPAALAAALSDPAVAAALSAVFAPELRDAVADGLEGGSAAVRADA